MYNCMKYKHINGMISGSYTFSGLFDMLFKLGYDARVAGLPIMNGLIRAVVDNYLNTRLASKELIAGVRELIVYDPNTKIYTMTQPDGMAAYADALYSAMLTQSNIAAVMQQEDLNIVQYIDIDQDIYGEKKRELDFDRVQVTLVNGERSSTIVNGEKQRDHSSNDDVTTNEVAGFNSSDYSPRDRTTFKEGNYTDRDLQSTDTSTDEESTDTSTTAKRNDIDTLRTYTDTHNRTRHYILSPDLYFAIQKEMADFSIYDAIARAVSDTVTINVWG